MSANKILFLNFFCPCLFTCRLKAPDLRIIHRFEQPDGTGRHALLKKLLCAHAYKGEFRQVLFSHR